MLGCSEERLVRPDARDELPPTVFCGCSSELADDTLPPPKFRTPLCVYPGMSKFAKLNALYRATLGTIVTRSPRWCSHPSRMSNVLNQPRPATFGIVEASG